MLPATSPTVLPAPTDTHSRARFVYNNKPKKNSLSFSLLHQLSAEKVPSKGHTDTH